MRKAKPSICFSGGKSIVWSRGCKSRAECAVFQGTILDGASWEAAQMKSKMYNEEPEKEIMLDSLDNLS